MTVQPHDVSHCTYDAKKFSTLNTVLSFRDHSQITTIESDMILNENGSSKLDESLNTKSIDEFSDNNQDSCATPILAPSYHHSEQSFPDGQFDESELVDPFKGPVNEVVITTTPSGNNNENETFTPDQIETFLRQTCDQFSLKNIDDSIEERMMSVEIQPPADLRPRYKSDGKRQIEKARTIPMVVKLPGLNSIQLETNQQFLLRLILTTYNPDPSAQLYIHPNKLEYHSHDTQELNDGTICVLLTADNIGEGKKGLPRLSIVKTKLGEYRPKLTPYHLARNDHEVHENMNSNEDEKLTVKKAKDIFKQFKLKASRIVCQLLIKQNESIHFTNITCETHVMHQKDQTNTSNKRSAKAMDSDDDDDDDDDEYSDKRPSTSKSKSIKRKKHV